MYAYRVPLVHWIRCHIRQRLSGFDSDRALIDCRVAHFLSGQGEIAVVAILRGHCDHCENKISLKYRLSLSISRKRDNGLVF